MKQAITSVYEKRSLYDVREIEVKSISSLSYKEYLSVTIPFMISTATQPLLGATNTAIMGHMDDAAYIAAVALGVILFNTMYWIFGFLRVSTTAFSSQALGKNSPTEQALSLFRPLSIAIVVGVSFLLLYPWIFQAYANLMKPEPQVVELMRQYCNILIFGAPFVLMNYVTLGWLMGQMLIRYTMMMQISMNVLNIFLSLFFVFGLGLGIEGVAWASLCAQVYGALVGFTFVYHRRHVMDVTDRLWRELRNLKPFLSMMKVNSDLMIRTCCLMGINNLFANAGSSLGTTTLAANAVILEIIFILAYFTDGMANGVSVFTGKAFGRRDLPLWKDTLTIAVRCWAVFVTGVVIALAMGRNELLRIITDVPDVYNLAVEYSFYLLVYPVFAGVGLLLYGMYTGIGQTASVRNMMLIAVAFFYVMQTITLPIWGNHGIWITYVCTYLLESIILVAFLGQARRRFETVLATQPV